MKRVVNCCDVTWQRFGVNTAGDAGMLRDEIHELETQLGMKVKELEETKQQLIDEKRNNEIVRCMSFHCSCFFLLYGFFLL